MLVVVRGKQVLFTKAACILNKQVRVESGPRIEVTGGVELYEVSAQS